MKRTKIKADLKNIPQQFHKLIEGADVYDSSCSAEARVIYIDRDCGYFLKKAPVGSLEKEALLARYFHKKGFTAPVIEYLSLEDDWLLSEKVLGEDATHSAYLEDPTRLAKKSAEILRTLHETDFSDCPIKTRMNDYFATVDENYKKGCFDLSYAKFATADEAYRVTTEGRNMFKNDTLLHGDYCLPNFLMQNWKFSGFVDLGHGGVGDRHVDIFWGAWTLNFNLHTDKYRNLFFDAYGRDKIDNDALLVVGAAEVFG